MRTALVVILCGLMMGGCSWINEKLHLQPDNEKERYGIDLDQTPQTPEA